MAGEEGFDQATRVRGGFDGVAGRTDTEVGEEIGKSRASVEQARRTGIASLKRSGSAMKFFISRM